MLTEMCYYTGSSESNASYFILAHDTRGGCWYDSRGWTFPPILHYILLPHDSCQQRGTLTKWYLTWKCICSKVWDPIPPSRIIFTQWHSSTLGEHLWRPNCGCKHSEAMGDSFQYLQQQHERQEKSQITLQIFMSTVCRLLFTPGENA